MLRLANGRHPADPTQSVLITDYVQVAAHEDHSALLQYRLPPLCRLAVTGAHSRTFPDRCHITCVDCWQHWQFLLLLWSIGVDRRLCQEGNFGSLPCWWRSPLPGVTGR